jgi:hypothetical protein
MKNNIEKYTKVEYLMSLEEYYKKYRRRSNKCELCGKQYKLPNYINTPRDKICFTCEFWLNVRETLKKAIA